MARAVDLLGDWWTPLVLREAFYGVRRFEVFQRRLGIGRNVLTARLERLVEEGLFDRVPYQERPSRHEYRLTSKGRAFFDVIAALMRWGDDHLAEAEGPPVILVDRRTGRAVRPRVVDENTGAPIVLQALEVRAGPGWPTELADGPADGTLR